MPRCLILDRSALDRASLQHRLAAYPEIELVGEASGLAHARELIARTQPELVFSDTHLTGGSAFDLFSDLPPSARLVFVTAQEAHAVRAFECNALDYLLKPVAAERLAVTLLRHVPVRAPRLPVAVRRGLAADDTLSLRCGGSTRFASVRLISVITAQDNYSQVVLASGDRAFLRRSLKSWEDTLPPRLFMRVHRTRIVNLARVTACRRASDARTLIELEGLQNPISASRYRWNELRSRLRLN